MRTLVVLVALLAGCSTPTEAPRPAAPILEDVVHQDDGEVIVEDVVETEGPSSVAFTVTDTGGSRLHEARGFLIGTPHVGHTDVHGQLAFFNVTPGEHTLRLEKEYYRVVEANFTLGTGQDKRLVVRMPVAEGLLSPPHVHDVWQGRTTVHLFEESWDVGTCVSNTCVKDGNPYARNRRFFFPPDGIIHPATGSVNVTLSWQDAHETLPVQVHYPKNATPQYDQFTFTPGEPVTIQIEPMAWDPPHATTSAWSLELAFFQGVMQGDLTVRVDIVRGDAVLSLDPPHPDHWQGRTEVRLADVDRTYVRSGRVPSVANLNYPQWERFDAGTLVYPGTTEMLVRAWINQTANLGGWRLELAPYHGATESASRPQYGLDPEVEGPLHTWRVAVRAEWSDPTYATESRWAWRLVPAGVPDEAGPAMADAQAHIVIDALRA